MSFSLVSVIPECYFNLLSCIFVLATVIMAFLYSPQSNAGIE